MNRINIFFTSFLIFSIPICSQEISISDKLSGNIIFRDFTASELNERHYMLMSYPPDSVFFNDELIYFTNDTCPPSGLLCNDWKFISTFENGTLKFQKEEGGPKILLTDSTILIFTVFTVDTLEMADTIFIKSGSVNSSNMIVIEYDLDGNYMRSKHWYSPFNCRYQIRESMMVEGNIYIAGEFESDTLQLDDQMIGDFANFGSVDIYTAAVDYQSLSCKWLRRLAGSGQETLGSMSISKTEDILVTGSDGSFWFEVCEDTLTNPWSFNFGDMFVSVLDAGGNCKWLKHVHHIGDIFGMASAFFSDGSVLVSGKYASEAEFIGDTTIFTSSRTSFLAKYSTEGNLAFVTQLEGEGTKSISQLVITNQDEVWVTGTYFNSPLVIGDIELPIRNPNEPNSDGFIAKYNKYGEPLYAASFGGDESDIPRRLHVQSDSMVYLVFDTNSEIIDIEGTEYSLDMNPYHAKILLLGIKDTSFINSVNDLFEPLKFKVYPNPTQNEIQLDFEKPLSESVFFRLVTIDGRQVRNEKLSKGQSQFSLSLSGLATGIYFYEIRNTAGHFLKSGKILKR